MKWILVVTLLHSNVAFVYSDHISYADCIDAQKHVPITEPSKLQCMTWEDFREMEIVPE